MSSKHKYVLKTVESLHFPAKINCMSHTKLIDIVIENLDKKQLNVIKEQCCIGHLLEMPCRQLGGSLVHELLLREILSSLNDQNKKKNDGMEFLIGSKIIRFSKKEFALMTGLSFEESTDDSLIYWSKNSSSSRLVERYFKGSKLISLIELEEQFVKCPDNNDKVKLGIVLLVEGVLLGKAKEHRINFKYLQLVEDFSKFNKYPWGKVSYDLTMMYLKKATRDRATSYIAKNQENPKHKFEQYKLGGFPFAFQVWAFESIPMLEGDCANKVKCNKPPRILHWECKNRTPPKNMQENFGSDQLDVLSHISPTEEEKKQHYLKKNLSMDEKDINDDQIPQRVLDGQMCAQLPLKRNKVDEKYDQVLSHIHPTKEGKKQHLKCSLSTDEVEDKDEQISQWALDGQIPARLPQKCKKVDKKASTFDPLGPIPPEKQNALDQYISNRTTKVGRINVGVYDADNTFFADLVKTNSWLSDTHMDSALYHMRIRSAKYPHKFGYRWTTTDCLWMEKVTQYNTLKSKKSGEGDDVGYFVQYMNGANLKFAKPWTAVDKVYVPVILKSSHWIAVEIDLVNKVLKVYDSMISPCRKHATVTALKSLTTLLPIIFESSDFYETRKELYESKSRPWKVERLAKGIPQQENGNDCGMFALKFIEFLSLGIPLATCKQEHMKFFRQKLAVDLFN